MTAYPISMILVHSPEHQSPGHPEGPHRFQTIRGELTEHLADKITWLEPEHVSEAVLTSVHPESYIRYIEESAAHGPGIVDYGDTYVTTSSFQDGLSAAAGALTTLGSITDGHAKKGFAIIRPPGHHASARKAMGFCLFNNIALVTRQAQSQGYQRVAILDFDVHHGNGTQDIFYADPDVLYLSTHQWGIFPGTGAKTETGSQKGKGTTVNIPLPAGVGDRGFEQVFERVIAPALERFNPNILLVSAGYDAHHRDPLAGLQVTSHGYFEMTRKINRYADRLCQGKLLMLLEGGYNPEALAISVRNSCLALAGLEPPPGSADTSQFAEPDIRDSLEEILRIHSL